MKTFRIRTVPLRPSSSSSSSSSSASSPSSDDAPPDPPADDVPDVEVDVEGQGTFAGVPAWLWILGAAFLLARARRG